MRTATRRIAATFGALLALLLTAAPAGAQTGLDVRIREADLGQRGETRLVVSVTGDAVDGRVLEAGAFEIIEDDEPVGDLSVEPVLESSEPTPITMALLVDTSGSTEGEPLALARTAATDFVRAATDNGIHVGLIAFGPEVEVLTEPTTDADALASAIEGLEADGETRLYDALTAGAELAGQREGLREIVVFSDGGDTTSERSLEEAVAAVEDVEAPISAVALQTQELDEAALQRLVSVTEGRLLPVDDPTVLAEAFDRVAREVASQYVLTYEGSLTDPDELGIEVRAEVAGATGTDRAVVANPRFAGEPLPAVPAPEQPVLEPFASDTGLRVGAAAALAAVLLLLGVFLVAPVRSRSQRALDHALDGEDPGAAADPQGTPSSESILSWAADAVEELPTSDERSEDLQTKLERAGWPLRSSEFRVLEIAGPLLGVIVGWGLLGHPLLAISLAVVGLLAPRAVLSRRIERRARRFDAQLPDVLQMLAGSLRAGYGLMQAIGTVAEESGEPASGEFGRVRSEARLGGSVSDALDAMADRIGSEDLRWAVIAINIQRRVGGDLAELLDTFADTVREREELRREVRSLSAEGRLSAWVLSVLPFLVAGYIAVVNPDYLSTLFESPGGLFAVLLALVLMGVGVFWIRRVIRIQI